MLTLSRHHSDPVSTATTLVGLLRARAAGEPGRVAYTFLSEGEGGEVSLTYGDLDRRARAVAAHLQAAGLAGERALLLYPPGFDYVAAFFGCLYAGVVGVPAPAPRLNRNLERLEALAADARAALALTTRAALAKARPTPEQTPFLARARWIATDEIDREEASAWREPDVEAGSLAYLQYTSGSTSTPKGVMVTHANVLHNSAYIARGFGHTPQSVALTWLPHFHDMGLVDGIIQPLYGGFRGLLLSPASFLQSPRRWLEAVTRFRVTHTGGPNFAYDLCARRIPAEERAGLDLSSWEVAYNGAEPVRHETLKRFAEAFAPCGFGERAFYPAYGLAEATLKVSGGARGGGAVVRAFEAEALEQNRVREAGESSEHGARVLVGSGRVSFGTEVVIVNPESLEPCGADGVGEIWVSGPGVAAGYWGRPEESEQTFGARLAVTGAGPFLCTGDLGFFSGGELFVTGRLKDLVIIRGRNHYPQDIELAVGVCHAELRAGGGAAFSVEAGGEERVVVLQELERRATDDAESVFEAVRACLAEEFELRPHAVLLLKPGSIPKTSSGKVQRRACRAMFLAGEFRPLAEWRGGEEGEPADPAPLRPASFDEEAVEAWLRARLAAVLRLDAAQVETNRPLTAYGLDSLAALELAHAVEQGLGARLQATDFLQCRSLSELAARALASRAGQDEDSAHAASRQAPTEESARLPRPLSHGQQALWFLHRVAPESAAYNVAAAVRLLEEVDVAALRRVFARLVERHAALRTTFAEEQGRPVQLVHERAELLFEVVDARAWDTAELDERVGEEARRPFDLERGPLLRVHLFERRAGEHVMLLAAHHIVVDFWSLAVLMHELGLLYESELTGEPARLDAPGAEFAEYARAQHEMLSGDKGARLFDYWRRQLAGELPALDLPTDHPRPAAQTYRGAALNLRLDEPLVRRLKELGRAHDATLYVTLLTAFNVLLYRHTGQEDLLVGSPTSGRAAARLAGVVGYFVNPVVIRSRAEGRLTFEEFLRQTRRTALEAFEHQDYPFDLLVTRLQPERDPARAPLFQAMFALHRAHLRGGDALAAFALGEGGTRARLGGLSVESVKLEQRTAQFDLSLTAAEVEGHLVASFEYNADLFDAETIRRISQRFEMLLRALADDPRRRLEELPLLPPEELRRVLPRRDASVARPPRYVHELFAERAALTPDKAAVRFDGREVGYRELDEASDRLARRLRARGVGPDVVVGLHVERSAEMFVGMLAVLKAGGAYLPLDPQYPRERLMFMLEDAGARVLLTQRHLADELRADNVEVVTFDDVDDPAHEAGAAVQVSADNLAYVIYTSGSTGKPKGVMVSHGALANFTEAAAREYGIAAQDRVLQFASFSFDASAEEIYPCLTRGATLVVATRDVQLSPSSLMKACREERLTVLDLPTAFWHELVTSLSTEDLKSAGDLRLVIIGGEEASPERLRTWKTKAGARVRLVNTYGPTEATVVATRCDLTGENEAATDSSEVFVKDPRRVPIGRPLPHVTAYVLNDALQPAPLGVRGELYLGGDGLARGYLKRPALTAERFVPDPYSAQPGARMYRTGDLARLLPGGELEFVGRADHQLKVRGFRVEPGEIEAALRRHAHVGDAVVQAFGGDAKRLVAYVSAARGEALDAGALRDHLKGRLPDHMVPAQFILLEALPLTPAGKLDRRALPAPEEAPRAGEGFVAPRDEVERKLCRIWADVLRVERIGVFDNFFESGGDSILSIQVVSRARQEGIALTPGQLFEHPTIAGLAAAATTTEAFEAEEAATSSAGPLTPVQRWFFEQHPFAPAHWNMALHVEPRERIDASLLARALALLVEHHDALRLRFVKEDGDWRQLVAEASADAAPFEVVDLSSLDEGVRHSALEAAATAAQSGLDLEHGPLMRVLLFEHGAGETQSLLFVVHHLAIDGVSWRILLADLERAYEQLRQGEAASLPPKTTSFQSWAARLGEYAQSPRQLEEVAYWSAPPAGEVAPLPREREGGPNTEGSARTVSVELSAEETRVLLREVPRAYRAQIGDALLAALTRAFARWTGSNTLHVELEGHGREELFEGVDLSRTVGWFTTIFPVLLGVDAGAGPGEWLGRVKEQLRGVPRGGIGYGLLRYLTTTSADALRALPRPEVSFNYLGQLDGTLGGASLFRMSQRPTGPVRDPAAARAALFEVNAYVLGERLRLEWSYSENVHERATVERLASDCAESLRSIAAHCVKPGARSYAPSDFPLARLDGRRLEELLRSRADVADIYPLAPMQQGLLFHSLYEPGADLYVGQVNCTLTGALDVEAFTRAWQVAVERHAVLRTSFAWEELDEPLQLVHERAHVEIEQSDLSALAPDEQARQLDALAEAERARGFDLATAPLMRLLLARLDGRTTRLVWTHHHLLLDGWSLALLLREVLDAYEAFARGAEPAQVSAGRGGEAANAYRAYVAWLRRQDAGRAEEFWRERLRDFTAPTPLGLARAGAREREAPAEPRRSRVRLSEESTSRLRDFARAHGLTLNTLAQGAWAVLLSRYSRERDVLFGATVSGRPAGLRGVGEMVGLFINTLPVRVRVEAEAPLVEWLGRLQVEQAAAREFEYSPLVEVQGWSEVPRGQALFESLLVFENYPVEALTNESAGTLRLSEVGSYDRTNYPLTIIAVPGESLSLQALYDSDRFDAGAVARLLGHLQTLLEGMAGDPRRRVAELPWLTAEERRLIDEWNDNRVNFPRGSTIHGLFEAQAAATPDATALVHEDARLSYHELNARAGRLAARLRKLGVGPESRVGVFTSRSVEMIVGLLGILKAGGAYVPLDPTYPQERLAFMLEDAGVSVLLTEGHLLGHLPPSGAHIICLDTDEHEVERKEEDGARPNVDEENLAYVIYTSGSTGRPKGVGITHRSAAVFSHWARASFDREVFAGSLFVTSICFDLSIFELFVPLHWGGTVILIDSILRLPELPAAGEVTLINTVPSAIGELLRLGHVPPRVGTINLAGEPLPGKLVRELYGLPQVERVYNLYGPTEDTTYSTWGLMERDSDETPSIGRPIHNTQARLLDPAGRPVPVGVPGELYLGGDGLARGYLKRPAMTAERFVPDPFSAQPGARMYRTGDLARYLPDGNIDFLGRIDQQVKIRGFRIEPGEIEAVLGRHESVRDCAVVAREEVAGDKRLVAYVVAKDSQASPSGLRDYLKERLLEHMVPSAFVMLDELPLTPNGKVDRKRLPAPEAAVHDDAEDYVAPRGPVEEVLAGIWRDVLRAERVGAHDNFFDLGGHSLLATRVLSGVRKIFRTELPLRVVFEAATVAELARAVIAHEARPGQAEKIAGAVQRVRGLSAEELRAELERKRRGVSKA